MPHSQLEPFRDRPVLRHLKRLTTANGIIQHADHDVPDPSFGYSIDDNARALIACLWHYRLFGDRSILELARIYFRYIERVEKEGGSFHNFLSFSEQILDPEGSEDSIGRAIWALGEVVESQADPELTAKAEAILGRAALGKHLEHPHIRTKAYICLGLLAAGRTNEAKEWAGKLADIFDERATKDWPWWENALYYANGILPYALAKMATALDNERFQTIAERSFEWLDRVSREHGVPAPIGQNGWYFQGQTKALYDQQPLEAADMVLAAAELHKLTHKPADLDKALGWYSWYEGYNMQRKSLINVATGGIYDALTPHGVNENQGAESIVTYLLAYLALTEQAGL